MKKALAISVLMALSTSVYSSPWAEAQDPLLRASMNVLKDAGLLDASLSSYPVRWSSIGDDLYSIDTSLYDHNVRLAYQYVRHNLEMSRLGRDSKKLSAFYSSENRASSGFGDINRGEWSVNAAYTSIGEKYALRLDNAYIKGQDGDKEYSFDNSFFAFGGKNWQLSLSKMERWWGFGWANSTQFSQNARPLSSLELVGSYGNVGFLDSLSVSTFAGIVDDKDGNWISASRISTTWNSLDVALSYIWADELTFGDEYRTVNSTLQKYTVDARLSLPQIAMIQTAIYGSYGQNKNGWDSEQESSSILGIELSALVWNTPLHVYAESFDTDESLFIKNEAQTVASNEKNTAIGAHVILPWDHFVDVSYKDIDNEDEATRSKLAYSLPSNYGKFTFAVEHSSDKHDSSTSGWVGWEYYLQ